MFQLLQNLKKVLKCSAMTERVMHKILQKD